MISDARLSEALTYLVETDEPCAIAKADAERMEFKAKAVRDAIFQRLEGSVADRSAEAGASDEYRNAMHAYFDQLAEYEKMRNKRQTEALVIEVWRSLNANQRKGNL